MTSAGLYMDLNIFLKMNEYKFSLIGLQVLVTALIDTIRKSVINIVALLLLTMFLFGIMGYYFFGYREDGDKEHWGDLGRAMLTLFRY